MKAKNKLTRSIFWLLYLSALGLIFYLIIRSSDAKALLRQLLTVFCFTAFPCALFALYSMLKKRWIYKIYHKRDLQSRKWLARFGHENQKKLQEYLHYFADSYLFPHEMVCKLSPDDEVMKFYLRYRKLSGADCMENEMFYDFIEGHYGLTDCDSIFEMTLGDLFELILKTQQEKPDTTKPV